MLLHLAAWPEIENYLKTSQTIIVPIGSTEQHGPNGLLGTDAICPEVIAHEIGKRCNLLIAPTIGIGMAQHHLGFPGSISLRPSTLLRVIEDVVNSLLVHGFKKIYFFNGHGGNIATVNAAFSEIYAQSSFAQREPFTQVDLRLQNWWEGSRVGKLSNEHFKGSEGSHATPSEVSLTYFVYPEAIKRVIMQPEIAPTGPIRDATDYRQQFADGRIGSNPALAKAEIGEKLLHASVEDTIEHLHAIGFISSK